VKTTYVDLKQRARERVAEKLRRAIAQHDGSSKAMREILRGLAAASDLAMDVTPFARELSKRLEILEKREPGRGRAAT
jgi:hypothetical protein